MIVQFLLYSMVPSIAALYLLINNEGFDSLISKYANGPTRAIAAHKRARNLTFT